MASTQKQDQKVKEVTGGLHSPVAWAGVTAAAALAGYAVMSPKACAAVGECKAAHDSVPVSLNSHTVGVLMAILMMEVAGLVSTYQGVRQTSALVPEIRSRCLPSLLLVGMFGVLVGQHSVFASIASPWYAHSAEDTSRPVYTMTYIEWLIIVPVLLTMSGYCAMGRPFHELTRPVVVTNIYIIFSWMASLSGSEAMRWGLIMTTFVMYAWASVDMLQWVAHYFQSAPKDLPLRLLRPSLSVGLIALFTVYGIVYISSVLSIISPKTERSAYLFLDVGAKLAMSASFVMIRTREYHSTFSSLLQKVSSSNVGLISILRGSFDFVLPCDVDGAGSCRLPRKQSADMNRLGSVLGRGVCGWDIADLMPNQQERASFQSYVANTLRQAMKVGGVNGTTLSADGDWSSSNGAQPPIAHVLNCGLAMAQKGGAAQIVQCSIHLSVIPRFAMVDENRWQVVAAMRLHDVEVPEAAGLNSVEEDSAMQAVPSNGGMVATLADVKALGVSHLLGGDEDNVTEGAPTVISSVNAETKLKKGDKIKGGKSKMDPGSDGESEFDSVSTAGGQYVSSKTSQTGSSQTGSRTSGKKEENWGRLPPMKPVSQN